MNTSPLRREPSQEIRKLYPYLTDEQLLEAKETLDRYIEHSVRMFKRITADPEAYKKFIELTDERIRARKAKGNKG